MDNPFPISDRTAISRTLHLRRPCQTSCCNATPPTRLSAWLPLSSTPRLSIDLAKPARMQATSPLATRLSSRRLKNADHLSRPWISRHLPRSTSRRQMAPSTTKQAKRTKSLKRASYILPNRSLICLTPSSRLNNRQRSHSTSTANAECVPSRRILVTRSRCPCLGHPSAALWRAIRVGIPSATG